METSGKIPFDIFAQVEMRVGYIEAAEPVPETDRLLKLTVNLGEAEPRQIVSGIAAYFPDLSMLVGKKCIFVSNLAPRVIKGLESNGMILAATASDGTFTLVVPEHDVPPGTKLK
jgi:methionyl-tRNA synthetase